jgi:hypothetical protein
MLKRLLDQSMFGNADANPNPNPYRYYVQKFLRVILKGKEVTSKNVATIT